MSEELRPCPFCGSADNHGNEDIYDPFDNACFMSTPGTDIRNLWQSRPLEDALQAKLDIAVEALRAIFGEDDHQCGWSNQIAEAALKRFEE